MTDLTEAQTEAIVGRIMEGTLPAAQVKDWLLGLRAKGESLSEVIGAARAMRSRMLRIDAGPLPAVDTCGTGGDNLKTANVSTLAALVAAGAGATVAKHGNRSVTSACGSADLLEALGVAIDVEPAVAQRCLAEVRFAFLFAPRFHPAMRAVAPVRKELGVPTLFNLLGPLTNPAGVRRQVVGVADPSKMEMYAQALRSLGAEKVMVVHGRDGQDEISTTGETDVLEFNTAVDPQRTARYTLVPETFGIRRARLEEIRGGDVQENARIAREVLDGKSGPVRDAVLINAAAALYAAGAAGDLANGLALARESVDRGKAKEVLEKIRRITHE